MVIVLIIIIAILLLAVVYLNIAFYKEKKDFAGKLEALQNIIVAIRQKQLGQNNQIQLSEDLDKKLKMSNATLSDSIYGLTYELFDILSKNNGLKK